MRKRLQENDGQADVSHLTPMSNHNPHHRSRSVMDHTKPAYESEANATSAAMTMSPMDMAGSSSRLGGQPYDVDRSGQSRLTPNHVGGLGGGGGGPGPGYGFVEEPTQRFSDLLNSTVVSDHFDQYGNLKEETIGRDIGYRDRRPSRNAAVNFDADVSRQPNANTATPIVLPSSASVQPQYISTSPAGAGGTVDDSECSASRPLSRRKTLPSIIKRSESYKCIAPLPEEATTSQHALNARSGDTYVIENGIRKRVKAEVYSQPPRPEPTSSSESIDKLRALPKRYRMEKASAAALSSKGPRGSLPDVSQCVEMQKNVMPREEVAKLSAQRREELRLQRERERLRKNREIVLSLADLKVRVT